MRYKLIGNELYIARKIELTDYERKLIKIMTTIDEVYMHDLVKVLKIPEIFVEPTITKLNQKLDYMQIVKFDAYSKKYRLITKE